MSDMTRALVSTALNILVWLGGIGIVGWFGYQAVAGVLNLKQLVIAVVAWVITFLVKKWVTAPFAKQEAEDKVRRAAKGKPLG